MNSKLDSSCSKEKSIFIFEEKKQNKIQTFLIVCLLINSWWFFLKKFSQQNTRWKDSNYKQNIKGFSLPLMSLLARSLSRLIVEAMFLNKGFSLLKSLLRKYPTPNSISAILS